MHLDHLTTVEARLIQKIKSYEETVKTIQAQLCALTERVDDKFNNLILREELDEYQKYLIYDNYGAAAAGKRVSNLMKNPMRLKMLKSESKMKWREVPRLS